MNLHILAISHLLFALDICKCHPLKPVFTRFPEDSYPLPRKQLILKCSATGFPIPSITWYKDGEIVQTQHDKPGTSNLITNHGELLFLSFSNEDEGEYYCNASNIHGWTTSATAIVKTAFLNVESSYDPQSKTAYLGDVVHMECAPPTGLPIPIFFWSHNSTRVQESSKIHIAPGSLKIESLSFLDSGEYRCHAENSVGSWKSKNAFLTVQRKPRYHFVPGNKQVVVAEDVEIQCLLSDDRNSTVIWKKDGVEIPRTSFLSQKNLRIENARPSDAGSYICEVKNSFGTLEAVSNLLVISPPSFLLTPDDREVSVGEDVYFDCRTSGTPPPTVRWVHNRRTLWIPKNHRPLDDGKFCVFPNGTLLIRSVSLADEGSYVCKASQLAGIVKAPAYLYIRALNSLPIPLIELGPQNQTLQVGTVATLPCQATVLRYPLRDDAHPSTFPSQLSIEWLINGARASSMNDPRIVPFPSGSLQINAVRLMDSGTYTCKVELDDLLQSHAPRITLWTASIQVSNVELGEVSTPTDYTYSTEHTTPPPPPEGLLVSDIGDTWLALEITNFLDVGSVSSLRHEHTSGYRIEVAEYGSSSDWQVVVPFTTDKNIYVGGLHPQTSYAVLVRSVNLEIVGRPLVLHHLVHTNPLTLTPEDASVVLETVNAAQFSPLYLRSISPSEITIEWLLCRSSVSSSLLENFKSTVRAVPLSHCLSLDRDQGVILRDVSHDARCSAPGFMDHGLFDNDGGMPHCSLAELTKTAVLDRSPPDFLAKEIVASVPPLNIGNKSMYKMTVDALRPFMCYSVELEALASYSRIDRFDAKKSLPATVITYDHPPSAAPKVFSVNWLQNATILEVSWNPPSEWEQGGVLTGFRLRVISLSPEFSRNIKVGPEQRSFRFSDLDPWTNYTIYLAAVNCRGEGVRSLPVHVFAQSDNFIDQPQFRRVIYDGRETVLGGSKTAFTVSIASDVSNEEPSDSLTREPWFVASVVAFVSLWTLIVIGLILCGRRRSRRQARPHDPADSDAVTKNGRLISVDNFVTSSWPPAGPTEAHPLVFDVNHFNEKTLLTNGYHGLITSNNNIHPGVSFSAFPPTNGGITGPLPAGYTHNPQYSIGPQRSLYATSDSLPVNISVTGVQPIRSSVPVTPNSQLPSRYDHMVATSTTAHTDLDNEDAVTPYASVPVMQQMLHYDPSASNGGALTRNPSDLNRQLSLAKIIPPPPDYPPPSLPSASPPPPSEHLTPWSPVCGSASGADDSAYYAQSEFQPAPSQQSISGQSKTLVQWSGSLPASDGSSGCLPHEDLSHHLTSGSQLFPTGTHLMMFPNTKPLTAGFAS